jgi:hypothetical protein
LQQQLLAAEEELRVANREKRSYERQLRQILQSKTWRLTEPARQVYLKLRRLLSSDRQALEGAKTIAPPP